MKTTSTRSLFIPILLTLMVQSLQAGGPLYTLNGKAVVYSGPIHYRVDLGPMGAFTAQEAANLAVSSFQVWEDVTTSTVSFVNDGSLSVDVNGSNYSLYTNDSTFVIDGISPIIFDSDGSITEALFGVGSKNDVIGFAGSAFNETGPNAGYFIEGEAVMNGYLTTATPDPTHVKFTLAEFKSTFVHEFGHFIGLDHTQINGAFVNDSSKTKYIPTMFPTATVNDVDLGNLNPDDIVAISVLYPTAGFPALTGSITGTITRANGSIVRGANVVAADTSNPLMNVFSTVSDYFVKATGAYAFAGLPAGSYWVNMEPIDPSFTGGSGVGPYSTSITDFSFQNPVAFDYYNGAGESASDNPQDRSPVTVAAGGIVPNINIIGNLPTYGVGTGVLVFHSEPLAYTEQLPSEYGDVGYAVRFTSGIKGKVARVDVRLGDDATAIRGTGSLKVTVRQNAAGSVGGVPGVQIGSSVSVPFSSLQKGVYNQINLSSANAFIKVGDDFHIAFEVVGKAGDTLQIGEDGGEVSSSRSSSYFDDGTGNTWYNFIDENNFGYGNNLMIRAVIDTAAVPSTYVLEDDFASAAGTLLTASGWTAHSGAGTNALTVTAPGLTFTGFAGSGIGNAVTLTTSGEDVNKTFADVSSGSVYASCLVNVTSAKAAGDYFLNLGQNPIGTTFLGRVYVKAASNGKLAFGVSKTTDAAAYSDSVYSLGVTYALVLKYSIVSGLANDSLRLYVLSGACASSEPAVPSAGPKGDASKTDATAIGSIAIRQGFAASAPALVLDGVRISTSWPASTTDVPDGVTAGIPTTTILEQNYPNPFNPSTAISYQLSAMSHVSLKVFDILGREVANLVDGEMAAGTHTVRFDAQHLNSGVYFYTLRTGSGAATKKMLLLR